MGTGPPMGNGNRGSGAFDVSLDRTKEVGGGKYVKRRGANGLNE